MIFELCQVVFERNQMIFEQNQVIIFNVSRHCGSNVCCSACPVKRGISEVAKISYKKKDGGEEEHWPLSKKVHTAKPPIALMLVPAKHHAIQKPC